MTDGNVDYVSSHVDGFGNSLRIGAACEPRLGGVGRLLGRLMQSAGLRLWRGKARGVVSGHISSDMDGLGNSLRMGGVGRLIRNAGLRLGRFRGRRVFFERMSLHLDGFGNVLRMGAG